MEQGPNQKPGAAGFGLLAVLVAVSLMLGLGRFFSRGEAVTAFSAATLPGAGAAKPVTAQIAPGSKLIPMGRAVGIKLFSDGVLVVGLAEVETEEGSKCPGRECGLKTGDVITHINGGEVDTIEQVQNLLTEQAGETLTIQAMRGQKQVQLTAAAVENQDGVYQLGLWLRDSMAGIGTMTFYDPETGMFAALGHGINDVDTAMLMPMESGSIMAATVADVKKGTTGQPGELHGQFDMTRDLGSLYANTERGVFGQMSQCDMMADGAALEVADPEQVETGPATILSNVQGDEVKEYDIKITHVDQDSKGTRNLMIQVTDPELLNQTGGIVQGMSGSPILQNGRIVGAVTHVLVNDPTRGYGIFIENMLDAAGNSIN